MLKMLVKRVMAELRLVMGLESSLKRTVLRQRSNMATWSHVYLVTRHVMKLNKKLADVTQNPSEKSAMTINC